MESIVFADLKTEGETPSAKIYLLCADYIAKACPTAVIDF